MERLTTTSYAILGQLALRPRTTYELAAEMRRNLHYFWTRAESLIYLEIKRLAALELVSATPGYTGRRRRTIYAVTPVGLEALQGWLATTPQRHFLEFEALLRVLLAPFGTRDELLRSLEKARADAEELIGVAVGIRREYLDGQAPFQEHVYVRAHVYDFLLHHAQMVHDWAERAIAEVRAWENLSPEERERRALAIFARGPATPVSDGDGTVAG